jgi:uncharacterized OB-fold protein
VRPGLFECNPPRLLGSRCDACGTAVFPSRDFCPRCRSEATRIGVPLSAQGAVHSYTVVHQAPGGRATPYVLAYVDLDDEVRVLARLDHAPTEVHIGMRVLLALGAVRHDSDGPVIGYHFVADAGARELQA